MRSLLFGLFLAGTIPLQPVFGESALFPPGRTRVIVIGVLEWSDSGLSSFSPENRKDRELAAVFARHGVASSRIDLLLDQKASLASIRSVVRASLSRITPDETLVFYYAGHGLKADDGRVYFANYDIDSSHPERTGFSVNELTDLLRSGFKGRSVWLLGDFCYSGAMAETARSLAAKGKSAVALTSAEASNVSSGNWTYTQTLIDALNGDPWLDLDKNQSITLGETVTAVREAMRFRESQRWGYVNFGAAESGIIERAKNVKLRDGFAYPGRNGRRWALSRWDDLIVPVKIVGEKPGFVLAEIYSYSRKEERIVRVDDISSIPVQTIPVGTKLRVLWGGKKWDAKVLKSEDGMHYITYPGWPSYWDEWITDDRIVK